MLLNIISHNTKYRAGKEIGDIDMGQILKDGGSSKDKKERINILQNKVRSVARLNRIFTNLRENSEMLLAIKSMSPDGKIPRGLLLSGRPAIRDAFCEYDLAKDLDKENEKFPKSRIRA